MESSIPKTDISLVSTVELLAELQERHQCSVFAGFHTLRVDSEGLADSSILFKHRGEAMRCMGLCEVVKQSIMAKFVNDIAFENEGE